MQDGTGNQRWIRCWDGAVEESMAHMGEGTHSITVDRRLLTGQSYAGEACALAVFPSTVHGDQGSSCM
jgi:hypothetical protein